MKPGPWILLTLLAVLHLPRAVASENSIAFLGPKGSYSDQAASDYASRAELSGTTPLGVDRGLPPIASLAIGTPEKAFVLALRRSEDDHGPLLNLFSILTILTVETELSRNMPPLNSVAIGAFKRPLSEGTSFPVPASYSCLPRRKAELAIYPATFRMA